MIAGSQSPILIVEVAFVTLSVCLIQEQYVGLTEVNSILLEIHESYERKNRELKAGSDAMSRELIKLRAHNAAVRRGAHAGSPDNPSEMRKELIELSQQLMESVAREKVAEESLQKLLSERDEAYSEDPKSSAFTREVVFDLSRECAELRRLYRAEIDEKQALQEELALLRSKVVHVTDLEAKCFAVTEELATMRFDMNRAELAYDKLRSDYDHEILLVDELKGECSDLRIELHRLCEDYDDVCASSRERELDDRDKLERLLNAYYTLRDDFESSQEGGMMDEDEETQRRMRGDDAPNVEASLRSNYDSLSSSGIVPGIAFVRKTRKASASTAPVAGSLGGNFFLKNANINI